MIIYIGVINAQNSYAVSRFVDHLIDILKQPVERTYSKDGNSHGFEHNIIR